MTGFDYDLIVRGGTLARPAAAGGPGLGDVAVLDGRIAALGGGASLPGSARQELDATGLHVLPGGVDPHVHFDEPGRTEWEGVASGTRALAAGGFTTYIDMPLNNIPLLLDGDSFDAKRAATEASALCDFAFWGGLVPGNLDRLAELHARGVAGFKAFMCYSGIEEFPGVDDLTLWEGMQRIAELGSILLVHAENADIVAGLGQRARAAGKKGVMDAVAARPAIAELEAIHRLLFFAEETGCATHVVHVSTARGVQLVAEARARGVDVTCETCPHFLLYTAEDVAAVGVSLKSAPPPRTAADRDELWARLADGTLPMVTSDHSPGPPELKVGDDFFALWGGISGCQHTLQLLLAAGLERRGLPLDTIVAVTSTNAARRFGLAGKGELAVGADADLTLIDLSEEWTLREEELLYRHRFSAYIGLPIRGRVRRTLLRGVTSFADGTFAERPLGRLITPTERSPL